MAFLTRRDSVCSIGPSSPSPSPSPDAEKLKEEVRAFGRAFKDALEKFEWQSVPQRASSSSSSSSKSFHSVFKALWRKGLVGETMRRLPREAGRLMRKWAVGKLKPSQAEAFHSNPVMKPSSEDAHYETRRRHLLSFVLIRLFADMSDSYFACGSSVFFSSQESGAKHIKKALDGEVEKQPDSLSPPPLQNEEEPSLFEIDDTADLRVPLSKTFGGLSQGESPLFGRNMKSKFSYTEDSQLGVFGRQETSFSEMSPTAPEKQHKWPVRGILHADPVPDSVLDEVVGWLRLAMVSIDLDPACSHSDHQVQDYGGDANDFKVYPFEQALNTHLVVTFALSLPLTLEALYKRLGVATKSSRLLTSTLRLREVLSDPWNMRGGNGVGPLTPLQTGSDTPTQPSQCFGGSQNSAVEGTPTLIRLRKSSAEFPEQDRKRKAEQDDKKKKKKRKVEQPDKSNLLSAELQRINSRQNLPQLRRVSSLSSR